MIGTADRTEKEPEMTTTKAFTTADITVGFRFKDLTGIIHTVVHVEGNEFTYENPEGRLSPGNITEFVNALEQRWVIKVRRASSK